ncbi:MAG: CHAT domain-containing protein [Cyclobacteriaceae bacterium]|nr:CHAT domain-containing protein [Cyclobacteriaceae bacterium]
MRYVKPLYILILVLALGSAKGQNTMEKAKALMESGNENQALEMLDAMQSQEPEYLNLLGEIWLKKGNSEKAVTYFEQAKDKLERTGSADRRLLGQTYNNIAVALWSQGKNSQALQYHQVALQNRETLKDPREIAASLNNIGLVYSNLQPDLALEYYERAKAIYEQMGLKDKIATSYVNIGLAYRNLKDYHEALQNLNEALDIRKKEFGENSTLVAFVYSSLASVFLATEDYRFANDYGQKALTIYQSNYGERHPEIATTYNLIGSTLLVQEKYREAIQAYQKAIEANQESFKAVDVYDLPPADGYFNADIYLVSLLQCARAFEALHTQLSLKINDLNQSYELLGIADQLIDKIRQFRTSEADKIALGNTASDVYESAIRVSLGMAGVKWKPMPYRERAFYFAEKSKSAVLLEAIADANAQSFAGIPDEMLAKEKEIKAEIAYLEQKLAETANEQKRKPLLAELFTWSEKYDKLKKTLEESYPEYYALKYDIKTPSVNEIGQKLPEGATLVSYFLGDNAKRLYVFFVTSKGLKVEDLAVTDDFDKNLTGYRNALYYKANETSKQVGLQLYHQLGLDKVPSGTEQLIVVPSGRISTVPLEALLTEEDDPKSYLVNKTPVSYLYAASLMQKNEGVSKEEQISLFAPVDFSGLGLAYLPGTKQEVEEIGSLFEKDKERANLFVEGKASKTAVTSEMVAQSNIIHFATHGIVDELHPERSQICLTTKDGSNGSLYTGEIYNLKFNADLVVLSACETGLGKLSKGEGIIGLTRAIIYSGARNMVVSLWSVSDASTSQLMIDFYNNLLSGQEYSQALANAKRKMITNAKYGEPYYWAPFVLIGY